MSSSFGFLHYDLFVLSIYLGLAISASDMIRLRNDILSNYSVGVLPLKNHSNSLNVKMSFFLIMIHQLNMKNQVLTASGWLKFEWRDEFLQWEPSDYGGIDEIILFQKEVWLPDIFVENTAQHYRELGNTQMLISVKSSGMVHWEPGIITETSCPINIGKYPFDRQICNIRFLTWMHTNRTLTVGPEFDTINLDALLPNGEWDITNTEAKMYKYPSTYRPGTEHTGVTFVVHLRRKRFFYVLNTIIPVVMLSCLNVLVFILPSDCGERMALAVTVLLAFTVYLGIISDNIPKTSESLSLLAIYLTSLLALSTASVVMAGIVLNIHYRNPSNPVPAFLTWIFASVPSGSHRKATTTSSVTDGYRRPSIWAARQALREGGSSPVELSGRIPYLVASGGFDILRSSRDHFQEDHYAIQEQSDSDEEQDSMDHQISFDVGNRRERFASSTGTGSEDDRRKNSGDHHSSIRSNHVREEAGLKGPPPDNASKPKRTKQQESLRYSKKKVHEGHRNHATHSSFKSVVSDDFELENRGRKTCDRYTFYNNSTVPNSSYECRNHSTGDLPPEIRYLLRKRDLEEKQKLKSVTWHDVGNCLDRWLFWVFFTLTNTATLVILVLFVQDDV